MIETIRVKFRRGDYANSSKLWDDIMNLKGSFEDLSYELTADLGYSYTIFLFPIIFQGVSVFILKGEMYDIVYLILNSYNLMSLTSTALKTSKLFYDLGHDILHCSSQRLKQMDAFTRENRHLLCNWDTIPSYKAFSLRLDSQFLLALVSIMSVAVLSVLWQTFNFRDLFLGNDSNVLNMDELKKASTENVSNLTAAVKEKQ